MTVVVAMHGQPFFLDCPFRWREPLHSAPMAADAFRTMVYSTECTVGFAGGDTNLYRRVGNSPINATDPSGNAVQIGTATGGAIVGGAIGGVAYLWMAGDDWTWGGLAASIGGGAVAGAVAGATFGASLALVGGSVSSQGVVTASLGQYAAASAISGGLGGLGGGFVQSVTAQGLQNGFNNIDPYRVGWDTLGGGVGGFIGGGVFGGAGHLFNRFAPAAMQLGKNAFTKVDDFFLGPPLVPALAGIGPSSAIAGTFAAAGRSAVLGAPFGTFSGSAFGSNLVFSMGGNRVNSPKALISNAGRVGADDMIRNLSGKGFADKVTTMRAMLTEAKTTNAGFRWMEAAGEAGEVVFIGSGKLLRDGKIIKNVVVIGRDGKVTRMTLDSLESLGRLPNRVRIKPNLGDPEVLIP